MMDGWMDECPFFVCPFFYVFFRATHLPQKARAHFSNMTGTLFEVLLGLAYFLWEKQKNPTLQQMNWLKSPLCNQEKKPPCENSAARQTVVTTLINYFIHWQTMLAQPSNCY